ncbi:unnamed protein product [Rotaria magnacalcarata]|uniref:Uncharacterized protein n=1 Tax=Rotaria magnacalcarata TaxID=392030 RepID=A0A815BI93_9BILA|nr:unnamed protein product [Rotaria magnacalcarata]CAF4704933.1 unnamed protein product [Rotaria magnacalcarata]
MSNINTNKANFCITNTTCSSLKPESSITKVTSSSFIFADATETTMTVLPEVVNQTSINNALNINEDKELARISYFNGTKRYIFLANSYKKDFMGNLNLWQIQNAYTTIPL